MQPAPSMHTYARNLHRLVHIGLAVLAVGANGGAVVAEANGVSFGRVASQPDATGRGYVLVNFK